MQILNSLDELLYEVMSWLVFFPLTLWRTITRPLTMMEYADSELLDDEEQQYEDALSPPLFLLLALLRAHGVEMAAGLAPLAAIGDSDRLASLVQNDSNLLILRLAIFSLIPMCLAVTQTTSRRQRITRKGLRPPFYAQCYPAGAMALLVGIGSTMVSSGISDAAPVGRIVIVVSACCYFALQIAWFRRRLGCGIGAALAKATGGFVAGLILAIGLALLFV